jgi:hypothetical protein
LIIASGNRTLLLGVERSGVGGNTAGTCLSVATVGTSGRGALTTFGVGGGGLVSASGGPSAENDWIDSGKGDVWR